MVHVFCVNCVSMLLVLLLYDECGGAFVVNNSLHSLTEACFLARDCWHVLL